MARDDEPITDAVEIATVDRQLEEIALAIERAAIARNAANYEIGQRLRQARDLHFRKPDGGFKGWVERRLGWTEQYAHRFIHAVESLRADETQLFSLLSASAFFAVARAPVEVRVQVAGLIESGAKMTAAAIKEMVPKVPKPERKPKAGSSAKQNATGTPYRHDLHDHTKTWTPSKIKALEAAKTETTFVEDMATATRKQMLDSIHSGMSMLDRCQMDALRGVLTAADWKRLMDDLAIGRDKRTVADQLTPKSPPRGNTDTGTVVDLLSRRRAAKTDDKAE